MSSARISCTSTTATPITTTIISSSTPTARWKTTRSGSQDHVTLVTVGIDIGSSGTQVIFSRINLRRYGEDLTSRYYVVSRETLFQSPVALTPYASEERIDDAALGDHHRRRLCGGGREARRHRHRRGHPHRRGAAARERRRPSPHCWRSRAAISSPPPPGITWSRCSPPTARARRSVSYDAGQAHPQHRHRRRHHQARPRREGRRDRDRGAAYRRPAAGGRRHRPHRPARPGGTASRPRRPASTGTRGDVLSPAQLDKVAESMADALVAALTQRPVPHAVEHLYLTDPIAELGQHRRHDVLRRRRRIRLRPRGRATSATWAAASARRSAGASMPARCPGRCCRPANASAPPRSAPPNTACSSRGNTSYISKPGELLPRRNLQVLQPSYVCEEVIDADKLAKAIRAHFTAFDLIEGEGEVALALRWLGAPSYERIAAFAEGIRHGLATTIERKKPIYHHARRRRRADARRDPARGAAGRERNPGHRRRGAARFRLHRSRPHPHAVVSPCRSRSSRWCSAKTRAAAARTSASTITTTGMTMITSMAITGTTTMITGMVTHHSHDHDAIDQRSWASSDHRHRRDRERMTERRVSPTARPRMPRGRPRTVMACTRALR